MLKQIKRRLLLHPVALAAPFHTPLEKRPITVTIIAPRPAMMDTVQKIALALLLVPCGLVFLISLLTADWRMVAFSLPVLFLIGVMVWILKLRRDMVWRVTWHEDQVAVEDGRYGPIEQWQAPLSEFTHLERDVGHLVSNRRYGSPDRAYGLHLTHPDPEKNILLHAQKEPIGQEIVDQYNRVLGPQLGRGES